MDNVLHAAGTFFVIIASAAVVTLGFFLMRSHNDSSRKVLEEQQKAAAAMSNSQYATYDGKTVTGDTVVMAIKQYQDEITVTVDGTVYPCDYQPQVSNPRKEGYVDVGANFAAELSYNDNGYVDGIVFRRV